MKLKIILAGAVLCAITATSAQAVTKCVALNTLNTTCTSTESASSYSYSTDWANTCTSNGITTSIKGVAACSSDISGVGGTSSTLSISSNQDENVYCWCKMTSPAVSKWAFRASYTHGVSCPDGCATSCATGLLEGSSTVTNFRRALFGNLSD